MEQSQRMSSLMAAGTALTLFASAASAESQVLTHYADVEASVWYEASAAALLERGALDRNESNLRPHDMATRAEASKMLVLLNDEPLVYPGTPSFDDVPTWSWYFAHMEAAAKADWIHGDSNCYQRSRPCNARPRDGVNRAEMATLMMRAFGFSQDNSAPAFSDNRRGMWYFNAIQAAADHCILQGDERTGNVRPGDFMNRAEMVVMFDRASMNLHYGTDCGPSAGPSADITNASAVASNRVRLVFSSNIDRSAADDAFRYNVERVSGGTVSVSRAIIVDDRTVDLELGASVVVGNNYRVTASDLRTAGGVTFSDSATFVLSESAGQVVSANLLGSNIVRVRFSTDISSADADDIFRYVVARASGGASVGIRRATYIDSRTVELELTSNPEANVDYNVTVSDIRSSGGVAFSGTVSLVRTEPVGQVVSVTAVSATRLRLTFNTGIEEARAEEIGRYRVSQDGRLLSLARAEYIDNTTVELFLDESLQTQRPYVVQVQDLRTIGGATFTGTGGTVFIGADVKFVATLTGLQETPPVTSLASGTGTFTLTATGLSYDITLKNLSGSLITGGHFHRGAVGVSGPVIQAITFTNNRATGTWANLTAQDRNDILSGIVYVNVHTAANPNGEIRGQLIKQ